MLTTRERALQAQLTDARKRLESASSAQSPRSATDGAREEAREELIRARAEASAAEARLRETSVSLEKNTTELAARNTALRALGAQLLKLREQLGAERERSAQLQGKVRDLSGDADGYAQTISALQSALRLAHEQKLAAGKRSKRGQSAAAPVFSELGATGAWDGEAAVAVEAGGGIAEGELAGDSGSGSGECSPRTRSPPSGACPCCPVVRAAPRQRLARVSAVRVPTLGPSACACACRSLR